MRSDPAQVAGVDVKRPLKELWSGITKEDLARHYERVAPYMLPHLRDRPLTLVRAPNGVDEGRFYQKDAHHLSKHVETCTFDDIDYVLVNKASDLVHLADQAVVEVHGWTSRCDEPERPDRIVFDLDPPHQDRFPDVVDAAGRLVRLVRASGGHPHVLLTGSKGMHIVVPIERGPDYDEIRAYTHTVVKVLLRHDKNLTIQMRKAKRGDRIFVDTLRNRPRQTAVMPWSPRVTGSYALPVGSSKQTDPRAARIGDSWPDAWPDFFDQAVPFSRLL